MTRENIIKLYRAIEESENTGNAKFKYGLLKNKKIVNIEIEKLKTEELEMTEIIKDYSEKRNDIIKKYGVTDKDGNISIDKESENFNTVIKELEELNIEYKESLDFYAEKQVEYAKKLNEPFEFNEEMFEISINNIPDEFKYQSLLIDFNILK